MSANYTPQEVEKYSRGYSIESVTTAYCICLSTIKIHVDYCMHNTVFPQSIV